MVRNPRDWHEVKRVHTALGQLRGENSESRAFHCVGNYVAKSREKKTGAFNWLITIRKVLPEENNAGVDLILLTSKGPIGVQVKSSSRYVERHIQSYPDIPVVIVEERRTDEEIAKEILQKIYDDYIRGSKKVGRNYIRRF